MEHHTPSQELFNEIKNAAIEIWNTYDNKHGYVDEKVGRINSISNYADNVMVCYRMFDHTNQTIMREVLSQEALRYIDDNN